MNNAPLLCEQKGKPTEVKREVGASVGCSCQNSMERRVPRFDYAGCSTITQTEDREELWVQP